MLRGRLCAVGAALLLCIGIGVAQDTADVVVGGEVVARVREAGAHDTVQARAAAIDEAINEALAAAEDPAAMDVTLESIDGLWTILIDGRRIMAVYPAEADANGMAPEVLGAIWVRKLKDALPAASAVEVTEIGAPAPGTATTAVLEESPAEPAPAPSPAAAPETAPAPTPAPAPAPAGDVPATGAVTNTGQPVVEVLEVPSEDSAPETVIAGEGARLLILKALNDARDLAEDDYLVQREVMADELFDQIVQVLSGGRARGTLTGGAAPAAAPLTTPPTPGASTATTTTAPPPVSTSTGTVTGGATGPTPAPAVGPVPDAAYQLSAEGRAQIEAAIPEGDPSYANVVQKVVIKAKFTAASDAYRTALSADPDTAAQAKEILTAARHAFTDGEYDAAENYLNAALQMLGVSTWEQHIGAAMAELGL